MRSYPEWTSYVADPSGPLFNALCARAGTPGQGAVTRAIEALVFTTQSWRTAQHLSLLHHKNRRLTEAWYFAELAVAWSDGDVRALVALLQVLEERSLPAVLGPLVRRIEAALETLPAAGRTPFQQFVTDAWGRVSKRLETEWRGGPEVETSALTTGVAREQAAEGAEARSDWLFSATLFAPGVTIDEPFCVGPFELTRRSEDRDTWEACFGSSLTTHGLVARGERIRARCFLRDVTQMEARHRGAAALRQLVALFPITRPMAVLEILPAGFVADLRGGAVEPLVPIEPLPVNVPPGPPEPTLGLLLAAPAAYGELGRAILRSAGWQALASAGPGSDETLFASCAACEALALVGPRDKLGPKVALALGLPSGRLARALSPQARSALEAVPELAPWSSKIAKLVDELRAASVASTRACHRGPDLAERLSTDDLRTLRASMEVAVPALQLLALAAARRGHRSVADLWEHAGALLVASRGGAEGLARSAEGMIGVLKG